MQALPDRCNDYFERSYKLDGKDVTERVFVQSDLKKGYVRSFDWSLSSNSQQVIERVFVFVRMYDKFAEIYQVLLNKYLKDIPNGAGKNLVSLIRTVEILLSSLLIVVVRKTRLILGMQLV